MRDADRLRFVVRRWSFLGIPLARSMAPTGDSCEYAADGRFRFQVEIGTPLTGAIVTYAGFLELQ